MDSVVGPEEKSLWQTRLHFSCFMLRRIYFASPPAAYN